MADDDIDGEEFGEELDEEVEVDEGEPEDLDEADLEEDFEELEEDDDFEDGEIADESDDDEPETPATPRRRASEDEDEDEDLTTEDDVEAALDTILSERLASADETNEDEDDEAEADDRGNEGDRLQPKRPDEQLCSSCFLLVRRGAPNCPIGDDDCPLFS
jgi:hypothetical protein